LRTTLVLWVITAIVYPAILLGTGLIFRFQANGSLIPDAQGKPVGSALIGQTFDTDKYFWTRPSAVSYSEGDKVPTGVSGASNLAPSNPDLLKRVKEVAQKLQQNQSSLTAYMVYGSGSGLDPHISTESALAQIERVARVRNLQRDRLTTLIEQNSDGRFLGIFGEVGVNVLKLNLALDRL